MIKTMEPQHFRSENVGKLNRRILIGELMPPRSNIFKPLDVSLEIVMRMLLMVENWVTALQSHVHREHVLCAFPECNCSVCCRTRPVQQEKAFSFAVSATLLLHHTPANAPMPCQQNPTSVKETQALGLNELLESDDLDILLEEASTVEMKATQEQDTSQIEPHTSQALV